MAREVAKEGDSLPTAMNAANEVAVAAFLKKSIKFNDIYKVIARTLSLHDKSKIMSIEDVLEIDKVSRTSAKKILKNI